MEKLWSQWKRLEPKIKDARLLLYLDYDGTLTPIAQHPRLAVLSPQKKKLLKEMAQLEETEIAVVSGRSLKELKDFVGVPGLVYAGNHGLEFEGPSFRFIHPEALQAGKLFETFLERMGKEFQTFPGVWIEDKRLTLSVHYRKLPLSRVKEAGKKLREFLSPHLERSQLVLTQGKKVWEVRPPLRWNKGTMVSWLLARVMAHDDTKKVFPLYVGDDQTDEDAFRVLKKRGLGIKVTRRPEEASEAPYCLDSTKEVFELLKKIKNLKEVSYAGR